MGRRARRLFGLAPGAFDGTLDGVLACLHPADRGRVAAELATAVREQAEYEGTFRVLRADGQSRAILSRGRMLNRASDPPVMSGVEFGRDRQPERRGAGQPPAPGHRGPGRGRHFRRGRASGHEAIGSSLPTAGVRSTVLAALDHSRSHLDIVAGDRLQPDVVRQWTPLPLRSVTPLTEAARTGRNVLALTPQELRGRVPEVSDDLALLGATGVLALPLRARGQVRGALAVHFHGPVALTAEDE